MHIHAYLYTYDFLEKYGHERVVTLPKWPPSDIYTRTYIHPHIYVYEYIYMYMCTCIYIYILIVFLNNNITSAS